MKKILLYSFAAMLFMVSCTKSENPKLPDLAQVPPPLLTIDKTANTVISGQNPTAFSGKFVVNLYYPTGPKPQKYDIVVEKDGDPTQVKTFLTGVTSFPTTVTVTGAQLTALFGTIVPGNSFTFGANVTTQSGVLYPAFPTVGTAFPTADFAAPGFNPTVSYSCICSFVATAYGAYGVPTPYTVVSDGWNDYAAGSTIMVTVIDATHISFYYATTINPKPIVITVDPNDNSTSVATVAYGSYVGDADVWSATSVAGSTKNIVTPCALGISVDLEQVGSVAGDQGGYTIVLQKK